MTDWPESPIDRLLPLLSEAKQTGERTWRARCPAHQDRNPSLDVRVGDDDTVLLQCRSQRCTAEAICVAVGLTLPDLFPTGSHRGNGRIAPSKPKRRYATIDDVVGALLRSSELHGGKDTRFRYADTFWMIRFDFDDDRPKTFRPLNCVEGEWAIGDPTGRLPLYRIEEAAKHGTVFVVEGEGVADALWVIGIPAVTSAHGSSSPQNSEWSTLAGQNIIIMPDNDGPGRKYAQNVAAILAMLGCTVKVATLPNLDEGEDIVNWIKAQGSRTAVELGAMVEQIANDAPTWKLGAQNVRKGSRDEPASWQPFPVQILPEALRDLVTEEAAAIGCDPSMVALPALAGCAGAIGTVRVIQLKRGWVEYPILWMGIVAASGTLKSPAMDKALRALRRAQALCFREHKTAIEAFEREWNAFEADLAAWKKRKPGERGEQPEKPKLPVCIRHIVSDVTIEAVAPILDANPRGILAARDELGGWLAGFNQYKGGKGGDIANWLELHRAGPVTVDRKTGVRLIHIPRAAVSVCGTIQPGTLRRALTPEFFECGLAARLLLAAPPERMKKWTDREAPLRVIDRFAEVVAQLLALDDALGPEGEPEPVCLRLSHEARTIWIDWFAECAEMLSAASEDRMKAAIAKIEGGAARLALIFQLVTDPASTEVGAEAMRTGATLARWFAHEASRVYAMWTQTAEDRERDQLVELIKRKGGSVTSRDLMRSSRRFATAEDAELALNELARQGLGLWEDVGSGDQGGRPTRRFRMIDSADADTTAKFPEEKEVVSASTMSTSSERELMEL